MADYECAPLWRDEAGHVGEVRPEDLGISDLLYDDLWQWAAVYDATLRVDDPAASAFNSAAEEQAFHEQGRHLTERLRRELAGRGQVRYWLDA
ncbi:hypothetical protein [Sphingomonas bisphenolicum]|nr:hypothetical protein [Sphingomonas bisphenolicum]